MACFLVHTAFVQEGGVLLVPALERRFKRRLSGFRQGQRQGPQRLCCWAFRLSGQVAHDDFDLVKLAHLHGNVRKRAQQAAFAVTDNALYHNTFLSQCSDRLRVERIGFPLDCRHCQGSLAASVVENHDAPFSTEIGGVHDEVNRRLWQRTFALCSGFGEVATDGFEAASVLRGKLWGALLAFAVALPKGVGIKALAPYELALTGAAMVLLFPVVTMPVFLNLFGAAKKAFFVFKGFVLA